jgi:cytochrome c peroxidase
MKPDEKDWGHPVANSLEWERIDSGMSASFRTRALVELGDVRSEFRTTTKAKAFAFALGGFGVVGLVVGWAARSLLPWWGVALCWISGLPLLLVAFLIYRYLSRPIVFDFEEGRFVGSDGEGVDFADVVGLQLVTGEEGGRHGSRDREPWYSHQLNLVLEDGERVLVVGHGDLAYLRPESERLSESMGVPLWDAAEGSEQCPPGARAPSRSVGRWGHARPGFEVRRVGSLRGGWQLPGSRRQHRVCARGAGFLRLLVRLSETPLIACPPGQPTEADRMTQQVPRALRFVAAGLLALPFVATAAAQQLLPPPVPNKNPITEEKRILGKLLFWDEQLSSDNTMACGTCHQSSAGGSDPRQGIHPGSGGTGDLNDKIGSPGVRRAGQAGRYKNDNPFGFEPQVTRRAAPSTYMAAYNRELFWDGRAPNTAVDPQTGEDLILNHGALESQVFHPPVSTTEMAHNGRDWDDICRKLEVARPLRLAIDLPPDMYAAILAHSAYQTLFEAAFGTPEITAARVAMAIATYERTLIPDDTPWDRFMAGDSNAMTNQQISGWNVFQNPDNSRCAICHLPPTFSDDSFRNIGLRPVEEDGGRRDVTGDNDDRGKFKVPSLRNVGIKPTLMHNGGVAQGDLDDMRDVIDFYEEANGHDQFNDNKDPLINGINIPGNLEDDLAAFLNGGLTDPRVAAGTFPFDRPTLASELDPGNPEMLGGGAPGGSTLVPQMIADSPPALGSLGFKLGVYGSVGGAPAFLHLSTQSPFGAGGVIAPMRVVPMTLLGSGVGDGNQTWVWDIPLDPSLFGFQMFAQWLVYDPTGVVEQRFARSDVAQLTFF